MLMNICDVQPNKISSNMKSKIFWFHGEPGTWKTTVASKFPKAFIAGFEVGYQFIEGVRALPMSGWSDMKELYRQLKTPQVKETYDTIVFDTISNAASMCYKYALGQLGINDPSEAAWGQGWRKIKDEWKIIQDIAKLGYCIIFISHSKETEVTDAKTKETTIKVKTDMEGWASDSVWGLSDFVFYVRKELETDGVTEKVYAYCDLPNVDTKRRHRGFPSKILFSYDNIVKGLDGLTDVNVKDNIREIEEESWEQVRDDVINLIGVLSETSAVDEINRYIPELFAGVRISQTTALDRPKLIAARDYLISLQDQLNGR